MPFDMGFNFRQTSGFVTDQAYGVPVLAEAYPHTYTNTNGDSINAGWVSNAPTPFNDASGNDPRLAGVNYRANNGGVNPNYFLVDLSSGSAPGAGAYSVDLAVGMASASQTVEFSVYDNTTVLIDGTNGGSGFTTGGAGHFIDATLADVTASTTWTGTPSSQTFATTSAQIGICPVSIGGFTTLAHFRLTLAGAAQSVVPLAMHSYRQRG